MGWPNWMRSRACSRASASAVRDAPTSSCATATLGQRDGPAPVDRRGDARVDLAFDLDEAEVWVHAVHRSSVQRRRVDERSDVTVIGPRDHQRRRANCSCETVHGDAIAVRAAGRFPLPRRTAARPTVAPSSSWPMAKAITWSSAEDVVPASPWISNNRDTAARGSKDSASCQPSSANARVERRRRCAARSRCAGCARTARDRRLRSSVVPQVEEAAGDDVALDLRAAAVDAGRP